MRYRVKSQDHLDGVELPDEASLTRFLGQDGVSYSVPRPHHYRVWVGGVPRYTVVLADPVPRPLDPGLSAFALSTVERAKDVLGDRVSVIVMVAVPTLKDQDESVWVTRGPLVQTRGLLETAVPKVRKFLEDQ